MEREVSTQRRRLLFFPLFLLVPLVHATVTTEMLYSESDGTVRALNRAPRLDCLCAFSGTAGFVVRHDIDGNR